MIPEWFEPPAGREALWDWLYQHRSQLLTELLSRAGKIPVWEKAPWAEDAPATPDTRRRYWLMRHWMYSDSEQAEILKRFPELNTITPQGNQKDNG